ncbi:MAG: cobalamin biosynthesis protein [Lachnospiraceae bacterium]|nr:cobalamin biosynthesis protein [Lachnospiraceae bacterium]
MSDIISFTERGLILAFRLRQVLEQEGCIYTKYSGVDRSLKDVEYVEEPLTEWAEKRFKERTPLIFIGAAGIAVRTIAPCIKDKFEDIPVVVLDEAGHFVIPILSAHYGGATELACEIAELIGAVPVITTATDVNNLFAVDVFAKNNDLVVANKDGIKKVSSKLLSRGKINMLLDGGKYIGRHPMELEILKKGDTDVFVSPFRLCEKTPKYKLRLIPKVVYAGIGCKRGKGFESIEALFDETMAKINIEPESIKGVATVDIKENEEGIRKFVRERKYNFQTFPAENLKRLKGKFTASAYVARAVGVDNVCERAAVAAAGDGAKLICKKTIGDGVTVAFAISDWSVRF